MRKRNTRRVGAGVLFATLALGCNRVAPAEPPENNGTLNDFLPLTPTPTRDPQTTFAGVLSAANLAQDLTDKLEELKALWMQEAEANNVLPLNDLQILGNPKDFETFIEMEFNVPVPPSGQYTYYPGTS